MSDKPDVTVYGQVPIHAGNMERPLPRDAEGKILPSSFARAIARKGGGMAQVTPTNVTPLSPRERAGSKDGLLPPRSLYRHNNCGNK